MSFRRALAAGLFGLVVAAVAPASWASAAAPAYPPGGSATISLSASTTTVGGTVRVTGSGFAANTAVSVTSTQTSQGFTAAGAADRLGDFAPVGRAATAAAVQGFALATVFTDGSGSFSTTLTFTVPGTYVVTASDGTQTASATVVVLAAGGVGGPGTGGTGVGGNNSSGTGQASGVGGLPNTGASIGLPVAAGAILVLVGAGLLTVVRRRKRGAAA